MSQQVPNLQFHDSSRSSVVFVDHAAEQLPAPHRRLERHDGGLIVIGWPLVPGLVRPVSVVMPGVGPQHSPQMGFVVDEHSVGALAPYDPYPAFGITVRSGCLWRGLHDLYALVGQDIIERGRE